MESIWPASAQRAGASASPVNKRQRPRDQRGQKDPVRGMLRHSESTEILDIREARAGESAWEVGRQLLWLGPCSLEEKEKFNLRHCHFHVAIADATGRRGVAPALAPAACGCALFWLLLVPVFPFFCVVPRSSSGGRGLYSL